MHVVLQRDGRSESVLREERVHDGQFRGDDDIEPTLAHGFHVAPRVLKQRNQIIGAMTGHRILKIQQTNAGDALPFRKPKQVFRVIVALDQDSPITASFIEQRLENLFKSLRFVFEG